VFKHRGARSFWGSHHPSFGAGKQGEILLLLGVFSEDMCGTLPHVANHKVLQAVGRRVAELRHQAGLTQEQLAEALDVGSQHVQRIERGSINSTLLALARLADVLGVELPALLEPSDHVRRVGRPRKTPAPEEKAAAPARKKTKKRPPKKTAGKKTKKR